MKTRLDVLKTIEEALNAQEGEFEEASPLENFGWDSMGKMVVIAALDSELEVSLEYGDLGGVVFVKDLVDLAFERV